MQDHIGYLTLKNYIALSESGNEMDKLLGTLWGAIVKIDKLVEPMPTKEADRPAIRLALGVVGLTRAQYLAEYLTQQLDKAIEKKA